MNNNINIPAIRHTRQGLRRTRTHERCNARVRHAPLPMWYARSGRAQLWPLRVSVRAAPGHEHVDLEEGRGPRGLGKARAGHAQPAPVERRRLLIDLCASTPQHPTSQIGWSRSPSDRADANEPPRLRCSAGAHAATARCAGPPSLWKNSLIAAMATRWDARCRSRCGPRSLSDQVRSER